MKNEKQKSKMKWWNTMPKAAIFSTSSALWLLLVGLSFTWKDLENEVVVQKILLRIYNKQMERQKKRKKVHSDYSIQENARNKGKSANKRTNN